LNKDKGYMATDGDERRAVVLLSGGLDSATTAAISRAAGFDLYTLAFDYGQRHRRELVAAQAVATALGAVQHRVVSFDLRAFGGSALTDDIAVPHSRSLDEMGHDIPITYVPGRNLIFLSFATAYAEVVGADDIFLGVNVLDSSGYPDCRPAFIDAFARTANLATKAGTQDGRELRIQAPLIQMTKAQIITRGLALGVPYELTWSCYEGGERACGTCDSCLLRLKGFTEAGAIDPIPYEEVMA
jgi:7-cyano-7-deazaguanine synthase